MGLDFLGPSALDRSFEILGAKRTSIDDSWDNPFGAERKVRDHYNELQVFLQERQAPHRRLHVYFRVFNKGVAFRYFPPEQAELKNFDTFYFCRGLALRNPCSVIPSEVSPTRC